ncbi:amidohydrolase family protein [Pedobacter flavus]|uniref:Amidohydrolase family protein n=1 Tax=Pedobacter flavus TaxID=3113906 RepID=A0ABU7GZS1_9SPHI|nr:amidohydrolase family protein [Pedobacter sp. VNH31]MEE1884569.1 amidohydrolase family protein [Pedobacter sp. VNH31]
MNKFLIATCLVASLSTQAFSQANIYPAKPQDKKIVLLGGTVHVGNGQVISNGYVTFEKGKITGVGDATTVKFSNTDATIHNLNGKHVYPGFIAPNTNLGLSEFESVKATLDFREIGQYNPHIRSIIAYNTDSKVPPTLRSNGVLMALIVPQGGVISGSSTAVQLDAWNWEDAAVKTDLGIHVNWPVTPRFRGAMGGGAAGGNNNTANAISELERFFIEAKSYNEVPQAVTNARFAGMKKLFDGTAKLFMHVNLQKDIVAAVNFAKRFNITPVIVGGSEASYVASFLKEQNVPVIINQPHSLPTSVDQDVNFPYKNASILNKAGVMVAISIDGYWEQRNLPFMAGTASTWGMSKEDALKTITSNTAKIIGIDNIAGSIEVGKDATLFISGGDALDMITNSIEKAFIQGRDIDLDNLHKQLDKRFSQKYGIK